MIVPHPFLLSWLHPFIISRPLTQFQPLIQLPLFNEQIFYHKDAFLLLITNVRKCKKKIQCKNLQ